MILILNIFDEKIIKYLFLCSLIIINLILSQKKYYEDYKFICMMRRARRILREKILVKSFNKADFEKAKLEWQGI